MQTLRLSCAATVVALALPLAASAQSLDDLRDMSPQERRDYIENLSPEAREHWQSMSAEEREAARQKHREDAARRRQHWDSMSDEDKAAARQRFRDHRHDMRRLHHEKRDRGQR
jgi:predicted Co/Zn/Cd cation transporter (cation efflux family)